MCGIAGFTQYRKDVADVPGLLKKMGSAIRHRGPDAAGVFFDEQVALCHQRLSIIDLSESGAQPMRSPSGRYITVYNGEIYNFQVLKMALVEEGVNFKGSSDTEVLIALYEKHGADCLGLLNGMFSLAIWDTQEQELFLARDRLGKKPLYFYQKGKRFLFASEIKSILCAEDIDRSIRNDAVQDYFFYQYVPDPKTIFKCIHKLPPGHWMRVDRDGSRQHQYWDVSFSKSHTGTRKQVENELFELLDDSVRSRMISDVPLGAFLSGGVDSSAVVGLMAANSTAPVTTCAIGFNSKKFDEVAYAAKVADQFKTQHHELTVQENVEENLVSIASFFDEPFADPSFVPTYYVSKLARSMVTVALAGDGGDENFAGYSKYLNDQRENSLRRWVPPGALSSGVLSSLSCLLADNPVSALRRSSSLMNTLSGDPARGFFLSNSFFRGHLWERIVDGKFAASVSGYDSAQLTRDYYECADTDDHLSRILYTDIKSYLPGGILVKVDRMSMANSLETRAPILDYRVVEFAATLPSSLKIHQGEGKRILKTSLEGFLTNDTLYRKKMGFSVPLASWLRKEISGVAERYLFAEGNGLSNFFSVAAIRELWMEHKAGSRDYSQELWSLLVFEIWWQQYMQ
ncbi:asparagine synthase (glutamine-hydrolyzing) [Chromatiales bacterium (ex Bugula neritina AB1)]|nr:asparagine synthase (glutamine-hydrolyzing) [Chromatiales bacterium (ex Bugula neritina AB1)]